MGATPYFDDGTVQLWHGDCRELTAWLDADVLVTDPPYGRGWRQGNLKSNGGNDGHAGIANDRDTSVRDAALKEWGTRPAVVFGDPLLPPPDGAKITLVYLKAVDAGMRGAIGGYRRDIEAVYLLGGFRSGLGGRSALLRSSTRMQSSPNGLTGRYQHPHAKPVDVLEQLISACPPGVVADPFCGSGSTLVAARNQGRRAVGVELEERYCEIAARRLSQTALDFGAAP
jgi:site-specific DNA-methyltransferase (adenine-specific)